MINSLEPAIFTVSLALTAHEQAQRIGRLHYRDKTQQAYLNSLAVYAVDYYLRCLGFSTDFSASSSQDSVLSCLLNTADLKVVDYGVVECCPLWLGDTSLAIPRAAWSQRIGYIAVQIEPSLKKASLIGFIEQVKSSPVPLSQLRSLDELPQYLEQKKQAQISAAIINLESWLDETIASSWLSLQQLFNSPTVALNFRWSNSLEPQAQDFPIISRGKILHFDSAAKDLLLMVGLIPYEQIEKEIWVRIATQDDSKILPSDLQLMIIDEQGKTIMQTDTLENSSIIVKFRGQTGEQFSIKIILAKEIQISTFII